MNYAVLLKMYGTSNEIREILYESSKTTLQCLIDLRTNTYCFFTIFKPDVKTVKRQRESHSFKVNIGGILHQDVGRMIGHF